MAFRGRGRGGGRFGRGGGGGFHPGKQDTWELFPENENVGTATEVVEKLHLARYYTKLQSYWKSSPYYYVDNRAASKKDQSADIERFSDMISDKSKPKPPLSHYIKMEAEFVPAELARGGNIENRNAKRVRWNPDADMKRLDIFEKMEKKAQGREKVEKKSDDEEDGEKVEDDDDDDDDGELSDDGDYVEIIENDDDEDDYNIIEDNDNEPTFGEDD